MKKRAPFSSSAVISVLLAGTALLTAPQALAQNVPSTVDPAQLQQRLQQPRLQREGDQIVIPQVSPEEMKQVSEEKVFVLQSVQLENGSVYSDSELEFFYRSHKGKKVSFADLQRIANRITNRYRNDGYVLSRVIVPPQKVKNGAVRLQAVEGFISQVNFEGEIKGDRSLLERYAAKIESARPIKAEVLERYMLLMDDLPGVTARSVIRPSADISQGATLVVSLDHKRYEGELAVDNRGNRFLGPIQLTGVAAINSGFGMYDRNTFRIISAGELDELFYGEFTHESQVGSEGTRVQLRLAHTASEPGSRLEPLEIEGTSHLAEMYVSYPHIRSRDENLEFFGGVRMQNIETDLLTANLFEDRIRVGEIGLQYDNTDEWQGINLLESSVSQGLDFLGATDDGAGRSRITGEHGFTRFNFRATRIQNLTPRWSVLASLRGQYSPDSLLSAERFALGGANFGRAYDGAEVTGDKGLATLFELRYAGLDAGEFVESYQPYIYYDIGSVWNNTTLVGEESRESLASAGLGVRFNMRGDYSGSAEIALPLTQDVASEKDDDARLFFSLQKRF